MFLFTEFHSRLVDIGKARNYMIFDSYDAELTYDEHTIPKQSDQRKALFQSFIIGNPQTIIKTAPAAVIAQQKSY